MNTDQGTQFYNPKKDNKGIRQKSKFEEYIEKQGMKYIPSRRKNPQTNCKLERRWLEYDKHRWRFKTLQE